MYKFNVGYLICLRSISKYDVDHSRVRGEILRLILDILKCQLW